MTKRKSKTTAEFKPPTRAQARAKRQKSTEEINLQSADDNQIQTPKSENNNSHNASCSEKLDEHQSEQSTLQISQTTEIPVDSCSLEEETSKDGNDTNAPAVSYEIEKTEEIAVHTPNPNNSDKYTLSIPSNVDVTNENQPDVELNNEKSEITSNSNHDSQKARDDCDSELPLDECQTERELSHEERKAIEPKMGERLGSSDIIAETSVDETGIQKTEDSADPLVKRKIRKRMGMCRLGERKRVLKGQLTSGNVFGGGQEAETGQVINEESVMMSEDLKKDDEEEEGTTESEASGSFFPTPRPLEDIPVREEQDQPEVQVQVESMTSKQEITHETDNTIPTHADPLEEIETECVKLGTNENVRDDKIEKTEIGTELTVDLAEVCKESAAVSPEDVVVIEGPLEALKETTEPSTSTSEADNHFEELLRVGGNEMEVEECECDMNSSVRADTDEQGVELKDIPASETVSALPEVEDKCESLDCTLVADTGENTVICEDRGMWSLSLPTALPCGEDKEVQSVTECDGAPSDAHELDPSPTAGPDPSSQSSVLSVTDSQLNNIPLSLEDFLLSEAACDLEDATDRVCGLIRDLAFLNQKLRDAHRRIGFQQCRNPPRPPFRSKYGPPH